VNGYEPRKESPLNVYTAVDAGEYRLDRVALWAGMVATALVASLLAVLGVMATQGLLGATVISPRGGVAFATTTGYELAVAAIVATVGAGVLVQLLMYVTPRPLLFFSLISALGTGVVAVWPFTTAAGVLDQVATSAVHLSLGVAIWLLTATVVRHAWLAP
jgi:hypothetical protein